MQPHDVASTSPVSLSASLRTRFVGSFIYAFAACIISMGTSLTPWFTLSARVTMDEISRRDECLLGADWTCSSPHMKTSAEDPGATSWQEVPAHVYLNRHKSASGYPKWNPYIGSGYPIFLDGMSRSVTPSRILLNYLPTDQARDLLIFFRFLVWTWGILFSLSLLGCSNAGYLLISGFAATLLPYVSRYLDIIFLDVDMLAPWLFVPPLILNLAHQGISANRALLAACLLSAAVGIWAGAQSFVQSQLVFGFIAGLVALFLWQQTQRKSLLACACFALPFASLMLPNALEFRKYLPELVSNRAFLGCVATAGIPFSEIIANSWSGFLRAPASFTFFTPLALPLLVWLALRRSDIRPWLALFSLLIGWISLGLPSLACQLPGVEATHFIRHLIPYIQSLFLILTLTALWFASHRLKIAKHYRALALALGLLLVIYPALSRAWISLKHLEGNYAKSVPVRWSPVSESSIYSWVQKISSSDDRRHFALDGRLFPNYSAALEILDLRVLYGVYPRRLFHLNDGLFQGWHNTPFYKHADRFVGGNLDADRLERDLEKVMVLHRVSVLSFGKQKNRLKQNEFYNESNCQLQATDTLAVAYLCPNILGVGFFPQQLMTAPSEAAAAAMLAAMSPKELIDFAVIETASSEASLTPSLASSRVPVAAKGSVRSHQRLNDRLVYSLEVKEAGYFVIADTNFPGWQAIVNSVPTPILNANVAFKAVWVPSGAVTVDLTFMKEADQ